MCDTYTNILPTLSIKTGHAPLNGPLIVTRTVGHKYYELKDHLGNVRATISDLRTMQAQATVESYNSYYPFRMLMPQRWNSSENYRYGFNGKEMDDDMSDGNTGTTYDYGFRIYDSQIGKFLSVDPLTKEYPWYTSYQFAGNKPIWAIDLDGLEEWLSNKGTANVLIVPGGDNDWDYDKITEDNKKDFDIIKTKTLKDANKLLESYGNLFNLVLSQHGDWQSTNLSAKAKVYTLELDNYKEKIPFWSDPTDDITGEIDALVDISRKISSGGTFTFRNCNLACKTPKGKVNNSNPIRKLAEYMFLGNPKLNIFANGDKTYLSNDNGLKIPYYFDLSSKQTSCTKFYWGWAQFTLGEDGKVSGSYSNKNLIFEDGKPKFESYIIDAIFGSNSSGKK